MVQCTKANPEFSYPLGRPCAVITPFMNLAPGGMEAAMEIILQSFVKNKIKMLIEMLRLARATSEIISIEYFLYSFTAKIK